MQSAMTGLQSLSGRLVLAAVVYVMAAQLIIYVPTIALYRYDWLVQRAESALLAAHARETTLEFTERLVDRGIGDILELTQIEGEVSEATKGEILETAGILTVAIRRNSIRQLVLQASPPFRIDASVDLKDNDFFTLVAGAWTTMTGDGTRILNIISVPDEEGVAVEYAASEAQLRAAMYNYSSTIWFVAAVISLVTGLLLFATIYRLLVRPMQRITTNMIAFRQAPEDASRILLPIHQMGELGEAERALSELQHDVRASLRQRARLAALGEAISKINHDLRNMLSSAMLLTDRIAMSEDPIVQKSAPRLVAAIDRAVDLSTNVLKFGKAEVATPERQEMDLHALVGDVAVSLELSPDTEVSLINNVALGFQINADSDHLFRVLMNLVRNAANALRESTESQIKIITIQAQDIEDGWEICIKDTGPGIPEHIRETIFQAFVSTRSEGTGLGLAIAAELVIGHGGILELLRTGVSGTEFRIFIPKNGGTPS